MAPITQHSQTNWQMHIYCYRLITEMNTAINNAESVPGSSIFGVVNDICDKTPKQKIWPLCWAISVTSSRPAEMMNALPWLLCYTFSWIQIEDGVYLMGVAGLAGGAKVHTPCHLIVQPHYAIVSSIHNGHLQAGSQQGCVSLSGLHSPGRPHRQGWQWQHLGQTGRKRKRDIP